MSDEQYAIAEQFLNSPFIDGIVVLLGSYVARNHVYSSDAVQKLTGVKDPVVPSVPSSNPPLTNVR